MASEVTGATLRAMTLSAVSVQLSVEAGIARLTLNRPEAGNAIDRTLCAQLRASAAELEGRTDVRVVILTGQGRNFCVGGDLSYFSDLEDVESELRDLAGDFHAGIESLRDLDAPLIAAVQGAVAGGGLSLACMCDLVLATESSRFIMAYTAAGLSPDGGSSWFLPRVVGWRLATQMMLTNNALTASEAQAAGLITTVVADDALGSETDALAARIAAGPAQAFGTVKRLLRSSATSSLHEQLDLEAREIARNAAGPDGREGVSAFLNKRTPEFR